VASPLPKRIIEIDSIRSLLDGGSVVVAAGGGGIPVMENEYGDLVGVEAVIDKDRASSLLARELNADIFFISTSVDRVYLNYNTPQQRGLDTITLAEAETYLAGGHFAPGSMKPKIEAAIEFLKSGGKMVYITDPEHLEDALDGNAGTRIVP